ncbi:MAG TPA: enoyl-CoA hydratase-related protein [Syntrophales bacterium]|nr:enoyl-CoA hydratase-related protein [Syntrophales bacterium]HPQ44656.1 enoyl-CoA hydratase-related protein [Syntrophales bacterium]
MRFLFSVSITDHGRWILLSTYGCGDARSRNGGRLRHSEDENNERSVKMEYQTIICDKSDRIAVITLNRPKNMNALNSQLLEELDCAIADIACDEEIKVVILTGNEKFFAAGADITEIDTIENSVDVHRFIHLVQNVINRIEDLEKPVIAAVCGLALGGGFELALACDIRLAAENAVFALPEIKLGLIPGGGGTQRLSRLIGTGLAKELVYTGNTIDAHETLRIGVVNKVYPLVSLMDEAKKVALKMAGYSGEAIKAAKLAINGGINMDVKSGIAYEARCFEVLFATEDRKEGVKAFIEKRKPQFNDR